MTSDGQMADAQRSRVCPSTLISRGPDSSDSDPNWYSVAAGMRYPIPCGLIDVDRGLKATC